MKTSRAIKLTLLLGSLALSLSQVPPMLEMVDGVRSGAAGELSGLSDAGRAFDMIGELRSQGLGADEQSDAAPAKLRVFSPEGEQLTDAQREELLAAAERMRPRIERRESAADSESAASSGSGEKEASGGESSEQGRATNSNLDPEMLKQLETLKSAEEALKSLTKVEDDEDK